MSKFLTGYINLSKIDRSKIFKTKSGDECINIWEYINDEPDSYGNIAAIQQPVEKDQKKNYIGNLKIFVKKDQNEPTQNESVATTEAPSNDLPF